MNAFGGDALRRNAMLHKSSFIIIDRTSIVMVIITGPLLEKIIFIQISVNGFSLYDDS